MLAEPHKICVKVWISTQARLTHVVWCPESRRVLDKLKKFDDVYHISRAEDWTALREFEPK